MLAGNVTQTNESGRTECIKVISKFQMGQVNRL